MSHDADPMGLAAAPGEATDAVRLVLTTVGSDAHADRLAQALVDERLAACVNVLPQVVSTYRWQGRVERETERMLIIKTTSDRLEALAARLTALHPYELPELLVLTPADASRGYLDWVRRETRPET